MDSWNIIGDVAGRFEELSLLLDKMPQGEVVLLGDLIDRGPDSKLVVQDARMNGYTVLLGNHEHMMVDYVIYKNRHYPSDIWFMNGGWKTVQSYLPKETRENEIVKREQIERALWDDAQWMETLPVMFTAPGLLCTHAPLRNLQALEVCKPIDLVWARNRPKEAIPGIYQVHGHNARTGVEQYMDHKGNFYGANIDTSSGRILTGMHWPSKEIFQQEYFHDP